MPGIPNFGGDDEEEEEEDSSSGPGTPSIG